MARVPSTEEPGRLNHTHYALAVCRWCGSNLVQNLLRTEIATLCEVEVCRICDQPEHPNGGTPPLLFR